jgi:FkbM family methyltransferase
MGSLSYSQSEMKLADIIARNELSYRVARKIVSRHRGENDSQMERNGEVRLLREVLPSCHTVFDVGANVGQWSTEALKINPSLDLHCFEPAPGAFLKLQEKVPNAVLNNVAVGAEPATLDLCVFSEESELNSFYQGAHTPIRKVRVPVTTLDEYATEIDFLKVDTEGHERAVIQGAKRLVAEHHIRVIQFEYSGWYAESRSLLRDMFELLSDYQIFKIMPWGRLPVTYSLDLENLQLANYVAMLRSDTLEDREVEHQGLRQGARRAVLHSHDEGPR